MDVIDALRKFARAAVGDRPADYASKPPASKPPKLRTQLRVVRDDE
jgi:hypothetical protein